MTFKVYSLVIAMFYSVFAYGQIIPEITCVSYVDNNTVSITWNQIPLADYFTDYVACGDPTAYLVKRANAVDGTFEVIHSEPYFDMGGPLIFNDTDAQVSIIPGYYKIELVVQSVNCLVESNIVAAVLLERTTVANNRIDLKWNIDSLTEGPIILQKKIEAGPWLDYDPIDSGVNSWDELINNCHGMANSIEISYRLKIIHPISGCEALSNVETGDFVDENAPVNVEFETISVDCLTGETVLYWNPSVESDVAGYTIQFLDGNNNGNNAARTFDGTQDSIVVGPIGLLGFPNPNPDNGAVSYYVLPFDNCNHLGADPILGGNGLPYDEFETIVATTIYLEYNYVVCDRSVQLNWTPYRSWVQGVDRYEIELSTDNGFSWEHIAVVEDDSDGYLVENLAENLDYCFVVKAFPNDTTSRESYSNKQCFTTSYPEVAVNYNIENVTVVSDNQTAITFSIDTDVIDANYRLEKLNEFGDQFESVGTYPQDVIAGGIFTVNDFGVNNASSGDEYRLIAFDPCNNQVGITSVSNSIHLEVFPEDGSIDNILTWNQYKKWDEGVGQYKIYFSNSEQMPLELKYVEPVTPEEQDIHTTFKLDNTSEFLHEESNFCYRVDAVSAATNKISQSNTKCVTQSPLFYLPNAMVLNGQNRVWKPEGGFIDFDSYELAIYDRWGTLLFDTKDFFIGWDGKYNGKHVKEGVYAYFIKYRESGGKEQYRSGALTVLQSF